VQVERAIVASGIASTHGVFDEYRQPLVPGRYASLTDVTVNIAVSAVGIWFAKWIQSKAGQDELCLLLAVNGLRRPGNSRHTTLP
jgi:hypothetical protein